jgi:DNA-binding NarL/FixJ family response regulator
LKRSDFTSRSQKQTRNHLRNRELTRTQNVERLAIEELSADELAIVKRLADGHKNAQIAADLELAVSEVESHRTAAMQKLNVRSRAELTRVAALRQW